MGQSSSSQRQPQESMPGDTHRYSQLGYDRLGGAPLNIGPQRPIQGHSDQIFSTRSRVQSQQPELQSSRPFATFSRQISAQSIPMRGNLASGGETSARDEIFYEQQEIRPLVHMEDLGMRNGPITHITASPMPRRHSILSRLSSRLVPQHSTAHSSRSPHEDDAEGRPHRPRLSNRLLPASYTSEASGHHRLSLTRPLSTAFPPFSRSRRQRDLAPISRPFPLMADESRPSPDFPVSSLHLPRSEVHSRLGPANNARQPSPLSRRASRLSRIRRSLSIPLENFSFMTRNDASGGGDIQNLPRRPSRASVADTDQYLLPPLSTTDHGIELSNTVIESNHPAGGNQRPQVFPSLAESPAGHPAWAEGLTQNERRAERGSGRRDTRRMPNIRGRSSRLIRRDDEGPLPRILHLAATAIAAQLSGTPEQAITNMQAIGADGLDGSLNALFRTLQQATTSTGDMPNSERDSDINRSSGTLPPLNFLRVFRFVNPTSDRGRAPRSRHEDHASQTAHNGDASGIADGRTVTLVVVGVRSVPSDRLEHEDATTAEPNLDNLLSLPVAPSTNTLGNGAGGPSRHVDGRSRLPQRRASMGGLNTFPTNNESHRHHSLLSSGRQSSADAITAGSSNIPLSHSESPPGPHPPPSTPAEPGLSAYSSGATTPNRRPSSASAAQRSPSNHDVVPRSLPDVGMLLAEDESIRVVQQRRRSDSEFARHRDLGAGAARRNGVVEPDQIDSADPPTHGSRSWLIYVVGTNLSEDHPAFATPSLFTDNPTYEDMLLLSSLLGPAKPPVASREDVASTFGVHRIQKSGASFVAASVDSAATIPITPGERCLVCLCEYEANEQVRQLAKCAHIFHRDCIDEWLTTGRNSCPLCRGHGVDERVAPTSS